MTEEFSKMKDEVPPALIDAHVKMVEKAVTEGKEVDQEFGLDQSGIAGTVPEKDEGKKNFVLFCNKFFLKVHGYKKSMRIQQILYLQMFYSLNYGQRNVFL